MSETTTRPLSGLSAMKLDELKGVASSMGITGTTKMRKSDLVEAIKARQSGGSSAPAAAAPVASAPAASAQVESASTDAEPVAAAAPVRTRSSRRVSRPAGSAAVAEPSAEAAAPSTVPEPRTENAAGDGSGDRKSVV